MEGQLDPKHKVSFTELPPEIRNIIYTVALVADKALEIQTFYPQRYHRQLEAGSCKEISLYRIKVASPQPSLPSKLRGTTYSLFSAIDHDVPLIAMLSLNRQTRKEAMPIFYGLNTFRFRVTNCVIPFMLDRTAAAVKLMESFQISLCLEEYDGLTCNGRTIAGCDTWIQTLSELGKFEDLRLKKLVVDVDGQCNDLDYSPEGFDFESSTSKWIPTLCEAINGLDMLGINYACDECTLRYIVTTTAVVDQIEEDLWKMLAPKMLKKIGDDHDADTLKHRRILDLDSLATDVSSTTEDEISSNASKIDSEPDSNQENEDEEDEEGEEGKEDESKEDGEGGDDVGDSEAKDDEEEAIEEGNADVGNSELKDAVGSRIEDHAFRER